MAICNCFLFCSTANSPQTHRFNNLFEELNSLYLSLFTVSFLDYTIPATNTYEGLPCEVWFQGLSFKSNTRKAKRRLQTILTARLRHGTQGTPNTAIRLSYCLDAFSSLYTPEFCFDKPHVFHLLSQPRGPSLSISESSYYKSEVQLPQSLSPCPVCFHCCRWWVVRNNQDSHHTSSVVPFYDNHVLSF